MIPTMSIGQKFCLTPAFMTGAPIALGGVPTWNVFPASLGMISSNGSSASFISAKSGFGWIKLSGIDSNGNKISKSRFINVVGNPMPTNGSGLPASTVCPMVSGSTGFGVSLGNNTGFGAPPGVSYGLKSTTPVPASMLARQGTPTYGTVDNFAAVGVGYNPFTSGYPVNNNYANPYNIVRFGNTNAPANYLDYVAASGIPGRY